MMGNLFIGRFLKKPPIIIIAGIMGLGLGGGILSLLRYAIYNAEARNVLKDLEKWNEDSPNYQHKFAGLNKNYGALKKNRPDF